MQFILSDKSCCNTQSCYEFEKESIYYPNQVQLSKIKLIHDDELLVGFRLYNHKHDNVFDAGLWAEPKMREQTVQLEEGERIIGYRSSSVLDEQG
jgi:hypothetical protein